MENSVFTCFNSLNEHEHICHLYYDDSECYEIATNFLLHGLESNNKCVYMSDRPAPLGLLSRLSGHGISKFKSSNKKAFEEILINNPIKESKKAQSFINKVRSKIEVFLNEDQGPIRVLMVHSDNFYYFTNTERLWIRAYLDKICLENPIILMNQFNVDRISSKDLISVLKTHPTLVEKNIVYQSPLYLDPEAIIKDLEKETETFKALSGKEKKVLELIINGLSNSGIAKELTISVKTVETHRANIMKKLEIHNLVDLVKFSMRNGIA
ncbi:MAG: LuxR C-terminal-related transcriptional regulator [Thermodesulfobacteriota bacterium]